MAVVTSPAPPTPLPHDGPRRLPFDVVDAKIQAPSLRSGTVSRPALVNRLRLNTEATVVAVTAPAGYGKTTLLAQWAARDRRPFAWVSVDERDQDPVVLLRHVAAALDPATRLDRDTVDALAAVGPSIWSSALPRLGAALAACEDPLVLVLDDAHVLRSEHSLEAVAALVDHLPAGSVLVVAGRADSRLRLAALRASGRLLEVGVHELALTPREAQLLLQGTGADLTLDEVRELVQRCEGWPAALYLAALAVRADESRTRRDESPLDLGHRDLTLSDYLRSEYLSRLRPGALRFLRRTAVLTRLCGGLCDAVLGESGSARELEKIEASNLFLIPLDRQRVWYRYHQLFRDLLLRELAEHEPELEPVLHRRAADWYELHGDPESALEHASVAGDLPRVARIVAAIALPVYHSGRAATVERWLSQFDEPFLERFPAVALQGGWIHALRGRRAEAERWLALAGGSRSLAPGIAALRATLGGEGVDRMIEDAEVALAGLPRDSQLRPAALVALGAGHQMLGQDERADVIYAEAAAEAERVGAAETCVLALSERSLLAASRNDVAATASLAQDAQELVDECGLEGYASTAAAFASRARASLWHGRWDEARALVARAERLTPLLDQASVPWFTLQVRLQLARVQLALRDRRAAEALLVEIRRLLEAHPHVGVLAEQADELEAELEAMPALREASGAGLTSAELRLLPFLATHLSFREIGEQLYVSRNTIKTQAISLYRKLDVSSRGEAIERAAQLGLLEPDARAS